MSNTPLNADGLDNFMHELGFLWDGFQGDWRNDGREQYGRDYDDSISMDLAKQLLADRKKHELQVRLDELEHLDDQSIGTEWKANKWFSVSDRIAELKQELEKL